MKTKLTYSDEQVGVFLPIKSERFELKRCLEEGDRKSAVLWACLIKGRALSDFKIFVFN